MLTFDSASTGYPFSFLLRAPVSDGFTFDDKEGSSYSDAFGGMDQARSLSVGDVDDYDNDDFEIQFPGYRANTAVFAVGITVGDNTAESGEFTAVDGTGGYTREMAGCVPDSPGTHGFLGVLSTVPLHRLFFNENSGTDDIFVRDLVFGVLEWED